MYGIGINLCRTVTKGAALSKVHRWPLVCSPYIVTSRKYMYTYGLPRSRSLAINKSNSREEYLAGKDYPTIGLMFKQYMSNMAARGVIFRQLFEGRTWTYTYLIADPDTKQAVLIDPVLETVDRDLKIVGDLGLDLKYAINTHVHADHVTGTGEIKKKLPSCKSMIAKVAGAKADLFFEHGDKIKFGNYELECRSTPGHTNGCSTFVWHEKNIAFTGDALLIRGCGRTDFQQGSSDRLFQSVHSQIFSLPDNYMLYPAHDYTGQTVTTVEEEKRCNPRLTKTKEEFIKIMENLNLPYPKYIDKALPANMVCGLYDVEESAPK